MGCYGSKEEGDSNGGGGNKGKAADAPKEYSWDKQKAQFNAQDFIVSKLKGQVVVKEPGSVNGQQFIIEDCDDCDIFVCDFSASVTIDHCTNCRIFVGPVESSIFVRNCKDCKCIIACQQWRTRECENLDVFLYTLTRPIIESSSNMRFACFQFYYPALLEQFEKAKLNPFINSWSMLYDFTPSQGNWELLPLDVKHTQFFKALPPSVLPESEANKLSVVPLTHGGRPKIGPENSFVAFFNEYKKYVPEFINELQQAEGNKAVVTQIREATIDADKAKEVFGNSDKFTGNIIGMEINAQNAIGVVRTFCEDFVRKMGDDKQIDKVLYFAPTLEIALHISNTFFESPDTVKSM